MSGSGDASARAIPGAVLLQFGWKSGVSGYGQVRGPVSGSTRTWVELVSEQHDRGGSQSFRSFEGHPHVRAIAGAKRADGDFRSGPTKR